MQNAPLGAFCNTFYLNLVIIGIEKQFLVFFLSGHLRIAHNYLVYLRLSTKACRQIKTELKLK